jgi:hypothetical protein
MSFSLSHRRWSVVALVVVLLTMSSGRIAAQGDSTCTWDRCALRLHGTFFGVKLVRGANDEKVTRFGWSPPALPFLAERSDSAARHYASYRSKQRKSALMSLLGTGAIVVGAIIANDNDNAIGPGLFLGGLTLTIGGGVVALSAHNELSRAIWWYNRTLPRDP